MGRTIEVECVDRRDGWWLQCRELQRTVMGSRKDRRGNGVERVDRQRRYGVRMRIGMRCLGNGCAGSVDMVKLRASALKIPEMNRWIGAARYHAVPM